MASVGHVPMQAPQSMQVASSHTAFPSSFIESDSTGQDPTQAPHPIQVSKLIFTGM